MKGGIPRVGLCAKRSAAPCFDKVACDGIVVVALNEQPFLLTYSSAQFEGFPGVLHGQTGFAEVGIGDAHGGVSHSEIRVELGGSLKKKQRGVVIAGPPSLIT